MNRSQRLHREDSLLDSIRQQVLAPADLHLILPDDDTSCNEADLCPRELNANNRTCQEQSSGIVAGNQRIGRTKEPDRSESESFDSDDCVAQIIGVYKRSAVLTFNIASLFIEREARDLAAHNQALKTRLSKRLYHAPIAPRLPAERNELSLESNNRDDRLENDNFFPVKRQNVAKRSRESVFQETMNYEEREAILASSVRTKRIKSMSMLLSNIKTLQCKLYAEMVDSQRSNNIPN